MNRKWLVVLLLCSADAALAQDPGVSVSVGARIWDTEWTTFSYFTDDNTPPNNLALTQVSASNELAIMPIVSVRYRDFVGSISALPSTRFSFPDDGSGTREEFDANVGYFVMPGLALTLGYKKVSQSGNAGRYRPAGPVVGVNANAPLGGAWSLYGSLGVGRLKTPGGDEIDFEADYRLAELGLAYTAAAALDVHRWLPHPGPDFERCLRHAGRQRHYAGLHSRRHRHILMISTLAAPHLRRGSPRNRTCR
jgi:hypothetical protein